MLRGGRGGLTLWGGGRPGVSQGDQPRGDTLLQGGVGGRWHRSLGSHSVPECPGEQPE